ncbi:MAG: phosphoribosylanthranilate isomerase [Alphaproteobacteria bacterium]
MTQVKICGLTRPEDIEAAILYGADYLGFIVEAKSARQLSVHQAATLSAPVKDIIPIVAVTVNPSNDLLRSIAQTMRPDFIQLHGDETPERVAAIKKRFGMKIIKALPISEQRDIAAMFAYQADMILLDAKPPKGEARGGHGVAFDWTLLKDTPLPETWLLAGGLNIKNARQAASQTKAPILDVSSGVELSPGRKSTRLIEVLISSVKTR